MDERKNYIAVLQRNWWWLVEWLVQLLDSHMTPANGQNWASGVLKSHHPTNTCTHAIGEMFLLKSTPTMMHTVCTTKSSPKMNPHLFTRRAVCVSDIRACLTPVREQRVTLEPLAWSLAWETNCYKSAYRHIYSLKVEKANPRIPQTTSLLKL